MKDYFTIIHYHQTSPEQFSSHISFLEKNYTLSPLRQLKDHYQSGSEIPDNSLFITFDDGWKSNYELLPIIEERGYPVTIFLSTGLIGTDKTPRPRIFDDKIKLDDSLLGLITDEPDTKIMITPSVREERRTMLNIGEIQEMSKHVDFQSHGVNHHASSALPVAMLESELVLSKNYIQDLVGNEVYAFAFPYNIVSENAFELFKKHGYVLARAGARKLNSPGAYPFTLNSIGVEPQWTVQELRKALLLAELKTLRSG